MTEKKHQGHCGCRCRRKVEDHHWLSRSLKDVGIWIGGVSFAGVSNSVSLDLSADVPESLTVFKGEWRRRAEGGLKTSSLLAGGLL